MIVVLSASPPTSTPNPNLAPVLMTVWASEYLGAVEVLVSGSLHREND